MKTKQVAMGITAAALALLTVICSAAVCFAGQDDEAVNSAKLSSVLLPDEFEEDSYGLRGFALSPDGQNMYLGFLHCMGQHPGQVSRYDTSTLEKTGEFIPYADPDISVDNMNCYPKGLAVDNRGFLYVGVTHAETEYVSIFCVGSNLVEISHIVESLGDVTGINGMAVQNIGDRILLYVLTCYDKDTIRCYDVTDPRNMKLYDGFGEGGVVDYNTLTGSQRDPGYIAVDLDGNVYITCLMDDSGLRKGSHVLKLSPDGKTIVASKSIREAYGISFAGDYLFVSTYDDSKSAVYVLNKEDLSEVKKMSLSSQDYPLTGTGYSGNYLYVASQGSESFGDAGEIFRTANELVITRDPRETEKMDPGDYEVPLPTEAPTDAPDDPAVTADNNSSGNGDNNSSSETSKSKWVPVLITVCLVVIAISAAAIIITAFKKKKK